VQSATTSDTVAAGACETGLPKPVAEVARRVVDDASAAKAEALPDAVRSLLSAGLAAHARPLVDELVVLLKSSPGPVATVIPIRRRPQDRKR
jgi:hypothetical protein